jgi:hypothetical protein
MAGVRAVACTAIVTWCLVVSAPAVAGSTTASEPERKSPVVATLAALGPALAGGALFVAGGRADSDPLVIAGLATLTIGPGAGHLYTRDGWRALLTTGIRVANVAVIGGSLYLLDRVGTGPDDDSPCAMTPLLGALLILIGTGAFGATIGFDVVDAPLSARRYNWRLDRRLDLSVTPTVMTTGAGLAPGLAFGGSF